MVEIIVETEPGTPYSLEVDQKEVIALSKTFLELQNIDVRKGDFTQSFGLPRGEVNDLIFGGFGDPSRIGAVWNPSLVLPAWIVEDGNIIIGGVLKLTENDPRLDKYVITVQGNVTTIKTILGDNDMSALDMSAWTYTPSQIYSTWNRSLFSGDMVFPIHDFGFGYGLYKKTGSALVLQDIKVSTTPIVLDNCIPAFRLNELLRMLFESRDFVVEGSWFSEDEVEEIYVQADNPLIEFASGIPLFNCVIGSTQSITISITTIRFIAVPVTGNWNNATFTYTAPQDGTYYWNLYLNPSPGIPNSNVMLVYWYVNGVSYSVTPGNWNTPFTLNNKNIPLTAGDTMSVRIAAVAPITTPGTLFSYGGHSLSLVNVVKSGGAQNPSEHWANYSQIDFLRAVIKVFNLIVWITPENKVRLDTWEYYMNNYGSRKDWTGKVDTESIVVKPINNELRNPINISYQKATDILNKDYERVIGRPYGGYFEDTALPNTLDKAPNFGIFAASPVQSIIGSIASADYDEVLVCKYYTDEDSIEYEPPGLQLMYYNGARDIPTDIYTADSAGDTPVARDNYPYFSPFRLYLVDSWQVQADTLDLNFTWWTPPSDIVDAPAELGLYNRYFREMLRARYDEANKIIEALFVLNSFDMNTFNFADTIVININGTPVGLKILEIKDYVPGQTKAVKVKAMLTFLDPDA